MGKLQGVNYLDVDTQKLSEGRLIEAYQGNDDLLDGITYEELLTTVFSNIENPDVKAVLRQFDELLKNKIKDAKYELRKAAPQIVKEIENEYN